MTTTANWFEVDKKGLAKVLERRGKEFVVYELFQNAWDTKCGLVSGSLHPVPGQPYALLRVWDDHPAGWTNLEHAYTLFAESEKKGDPEKRGRFNLGEKLVLALCQEARIESTTGTVVFSSDGRRRRFKSGTREGSSFEAHIRMTRDEYEQVERAVRRLIPPAGVQTRWNGTLIGHARPLRTISCVLPTETSDAEGILRKTSRRTSVEVIDVQPGDVATLYEMGIPVVETRDKWHYNIQQKVPLNSDRDNVTPGYLRELRTLVLNEMHQDLAPEEAASKWVHDGLADDKVTKETTEQVMKLQFGEKRVIADMNDPEGTKLAMSLEYTVIPPRALSKEVWANVRKHEAALPAGRVTPSPKPFSPDGKPLEFIPVSDWTEDMGRITRYIEALGSALLKRSVTVRMTRDRHWQFRACYGAGDLILNVAKLGSSWFEEGPNQAVDELVIHELGHEASPDHLSDKYHHALCSLGAKLAALAITQPEFFTKHRWRF